MFNMSGRELRMLVSTSELPAECLKKADILLESLMVMRLTAPF